MSNEVRCLDRRRSGHPTSLRHAGSGNGNGHGHGRPEIEYAKELNMDVLVFSVLTNFAAGLDNRILKNEEVVASAKKVENDFGRLVIQTINNIGRK